MAIGTTAAILGASAIGAGASVLSASSAAKSQERAGQAQIDVQERMHEQSRLDLAPYREAGLPAVNALNFNLGIGDRPEGYEGFQATPGYQFALDEQRKAVEASAAARGGLFSGGTMQAVQERGNNLANMEFGNYLSRLSGQATMGQNAAAQSATINTNTANGVSNALGSIGNAQAAGAIGVGNALNSGIQNGVGAWQYQNALNNQYAKNNAIISGGGIY